MPNENKAKGDALEKAVRLIQETILKSDPDFAGIQFTIEHNEILKIAGVRHEIDVLVKTLPRSQYESVWIFECKNWNKPVGKDEMIKLAEKVKATGAARGFLVARKFTADAEAQAKLDNRLKLLHCTDDFSAHFELTHTVHVPEPIQISIKQRGVPPLEKPNQLDWKRASWLLNGKPTNFAQFLLPYIDNEMEADKTENNAKYNRDSSHCSSRSSLIEFERGEFTFDTVDVEYLRIDVKFWVKVQRLKLISKFELRSQGRVFSFAPIIDEGTGKQIQIDLVQRI